MPTDTNLPTKQGETVSYDDINLDLNAEIVKLKQSEPREFWIEKFNGRKNPSYYAFKDKPNFNRIQLKEDDGTVIQGYEYFNVIEKSYADQLAAQLAEARAEVERTKEFGKETVWVGETNEQMRKRLFDAYEENTKLRAKLEDYRESLAWYATHEEIMNNAYSNSGLWHRARYVLAKWAKGEE